MKQALILGLLMTINYLVIAVNMRAVAHIQYEWIAATDALLCIINFSVIKRVAEAKTLIDRICYAVGGTVGALLGVWLSRSWG